MGWSSHEILPSDTWDHAMFEVTQDMLDSAKDPVLTIDFERSSMFGDPDFYLGFDKWPTLAEYEWSSVYCESCGGKNKRITIHGDSLRSGVYRASVHAFCCQDTMYRYTAKLWLAHGDIPYGDDDSSSSRDP